MSYTAFDPTKPVTSPDTRQVTIDAIRTNMLALRDAVIAGELSGFNFSTSGGTTAQPTYMLYTKGAEIIRQTFTWGTSGGSNGNPTVIYFEYSANTGSTYVALAPYATCTYSYDSNGYVTSTTWS